MTIVGRRGGGKSQVVQRSFFVHALIYLPFLLSYLLDQFWRAARIGTMCVSRSCWYWATAQAAGEKDDFLLWSRNSPDSDITNFDSNTNAYP
jgi:hypothetical protein